jgi:hypothetical protein
MTGDISLRQRVHQGMAIEIDRDGSGGLAVLAAPGRAVVPVLRQAGRKWLKRQRAERASGTSVRARAAF